MAKLVTLIAGAALVTRGFGQLRGPRALPPVVAAPPVPFGSLAAGTRRALVEPVHADLRDHYYVHNGEKHYYKYGSIKYKQMVKEKKKARRAKMEYPVGYVKGEKLPPKIRIEAPYLRKKWMHILPKNFSWPVSKYVEEGGTPAPGFDWRTVKRGSGNPIKRRSRQNQWTNQDIIDYRDGRSMWNMTLTPDMVNRFEYNRLMLLKQLPGNREYKIPKYLIFGRKKQNKYGAKEDGGEEAPSLSSFSDDGSVRLVGITAFAVAMVFVAVVSVSLERRARQVTYQGLLG